MDKARPAFSLRCWMKNKLLECDNFISLFGEAYLSELKFSVVKKIPFNLV